MTDLEIANNIKLQKIEKIAKKLNLNSKNIEKYGNYKAKINAVSNKKRGKLVLVTSINPTPYGEGKTTVTIGINDALRKLKKNSVAALREPSLGPVFGIKGGATGGGYAQVMPSIDINLHFTGDFHAITSANNLISSIIDNHIYQGNDLNIDINKILFKRCIDLNDRALRKVKIDERYENFDITAASEIMAILCLSKDIDDLKEKLSNILIAYDKNSNPIFLKNLNCVDSIVILLKDAIKPNLVQSLENNPIIIHGGPFANIAHGCNSLIATNTALSLADFVITEAGFGADLGAEKFFDIKCRNDLKPDCVVINFTIKALKHNGYCPKEKIQEENISYIEKGFINLLTHIENISKFTNNIVICLNKYSSDTDLEINYLEGKINSLGYKMQICDSYTSGNDGAISLAKEIINICNRPNDFNFLYDLEENIENKITKICKEIYRANSLKFTENAKNTIREIEESGFDKLPICIAKTQYSLTNDKNILGKPNEYDIEIDEISLKSGAGFIVVYLGDIMTMPGLNKSPNLLNMKYENNKIEGIF